MVKVRTTIYLRSTFMSPRSSARSSLYGMNGNSLVNGSFRPRVMGFACTLRWPSGARRRVARYNVSLCARTLGARTSTGSSSATVARFPTVCIPRFFHVCSVNSVSHGQNAKTSSKRRREIAKSHTDIGVSNNKLDSQTALCKRCSMPLKNLSWPINSIAREIHEVEYAS